MEDKNFNIRKVNGSIILEKDNQKIYIEQSIDDDILFSTHKEELPIEFNFYSRNRKECQIYMIFESLMKSIIGRFILNGDYKNEYSILPKDFIDLEKNTIIWHSDGGANNTLKIEYNDKTIKILISKDKESHSQGTVRIRTDGSNYGYYYQEFLEFFKELCILEHRLNRPIEKISQVGADTFKRKGLSLFIGKKK